MQSLFVPVVRNAACLDACAPVFIKGLFWAPLNPQWVLYIYLADKADVRPCCGWYFATRLAAEGRRQSLARATPGTVNEVFAFQLPVHFSPLVGAVRQGVF